MKMKKALLVLALAAPAIAAAGDADHWYLTPEVGGISPDYKRALQDDNWLFGLAFGREINEYLNLELNTEADRLNYHHLPGDFYTYSATLDALAILNREGTVAPYLRLGAGVLRNTPNDAPNQTHFGTDAGIGTYLNLWRSEDETAAFSLRPEIKVLWDEPGRGQHLNDYVATLGFQYAFAYNMRLSRRRAEAVRQFLIGDGVDPSQLSARGYGPEHPVASNRTADGRSQNRRVVLEVLSNPNGIKVKGQGSTD